MPDSVSTQHRYLANLELPDLLARLRTASGIADLVLWEMVAINQFYTPVIAGPETALRLGIRPGEIIGYLVSEPRGTGSVAADAIVPHQNQAPPARDLLGAARWRSRTAGSR